MPKKTSYTEVKEYINNIGYTLVTSETDYKNTMTPIFIKCNNNHTYKTIFSTIKHTNSRCLECRNLHTKSFEFIKNSVEKFGFKLLTEKKDYVDTKTKLQVECQNNHISYKRYNDISQGHTRCRQCYFNFNRGKNHVKYLDDRSQLILLRVIRTCRSKSWIKNNMKSDPNYEDFIQDPVKYNLDHIIPLYLFLKLILDFKLNEQEIKKIINKKENLQILTSHQNKIKNSKGSIFEAAQYLMLNGIKLV